MKIEDVLKVAVPVGIAIMIFSLFKPTEEEGIEITKIEVE